jgi:hypothetical protein
MEVEKFRTSSRLFNVDNPNKFSILINRGLLTHNESISSVKSVSIPQIADDSVETFFNNKWVIARGRSTINQIQISMRNIESLALYSRYTDFMHQAVNKYPADQYVNITITYEGNYKGDTKRRIVFEECIMTNLSELTFDHSTVNSTLDFSIGFKCNSFTVE